MEFSAASPVSRSSYRSLFPPHTPHEEQPQLEQSEQPQELQVQGDMFGSLEARMYRSYLGGLQFWDISRFVQGVREISEWVGKSSLDGGDARSSYMCGRMRRGMGGHASHVGS